MPQAQSSPSETVEILKIVVPAISSFLGALLAGALAFLSARWSTRTAHQNALHQSRRSLFQVQIVEAHRGAMLVLTDFLSGRITRDELLRTLVPLSVWFSSRTAAIVAKLKAALDETQMTTEANALLEQLRAEAGITT